MKKLLSMLSLVFAPAVALAQAAVDVPAPTPTNWREALWTIIIIPAVAFLWTELRAWAAARRRQAQVAADTSSRAYAEELLFRLVDAVGAPLMADLKPAFVTATDPASPGGAAITAEEWRELYTAIEKELRELLTADKLNLVMKTIGMNSAVRLLAAWLIKRVFAVRQSASQLPGVPAIDAGAALYGTPVPGVSTGAEG